MKRCTHCGREFAATTEFFYRDRGRADGLYYWCKACTRGRDRRYREAHPDKMREIDRRYREAHPEKRRESDRRWQQAHPEKRRESNRRYREAHPDKMRERVRRWQQAHPEKRREYHRRRRARKAGAEGSYTQAEVDAQYKRQKGRCYYARCGHCKLNGKYHVEHVVPLNRGGRNDLSNIVLSCADCNGKKGTKLPHEWLEGGRLL